MGEHNSLVDLKSWVYDDNLLQQPWLEISQVCMFRTDHWFYLRINNLALKYPLFTSWYKQTLKFRAENNILFVFEVHK